MKLLFHGPYKYGDSYSGNSRNLLYWLDKMGLEIVCPASYSAPNWEHVPNEIPEYIAEAMDRWQTAPKPQPGKYFTFQHCVPTTFVYDPDSYMNIGYTMFETDRIPRNWLLPSMAMDEIWTPTVWCGKTFAATGLGKQKIRVLPCGFDPLIFNTEAKPMQLDPLAGKVVFGCCFDWTPRKNGRQTVAAFLKAFEGVEDVVLVLKCFFKFGSENGMEYMKEQISSLRSATGVKGKPDIVLYPEIIPDQHMGSFYRSLDWHLSATHGEGFNKPVVEAMACGVPSITTMWSGQTDFCNADNSLLIGDCPLGAIESDQIQMGGMEYMGAGWAMPAFDNLVENLRYAYSISKEEKAVHNELAKNCVATAQAFTWENVAKRAGKLMETALNER